MKKILFVCTANAFRSLSAELLLKKYLSDNKIKNWKVSSAGTKCNPQKIDKTVLKCLEERKIKVNHKQIKLTKKLVEDYDLIVPLAKNHSRFIKNNFPNKKTFLFNELAIGKNTSVFDVGAEGNGIELSPKQEDEKVTQTINYIDKNIPKLYKNIKK